MVEETNVLLFDLIGFFLSRIFCELWITPV